MFSDHAGRNQLSDIECSSLGREFAIRWIGVAQYLKDNFAAVYLFNSAVDKRVDTTVEQLSNLVSGNAWWRAGQG